MPNPVSLPTKEEEERRAWVTQHHEVVRLVKDAFGDRFSNNEIFDRLKISRRTGYRALGNDDRIGKTPGRKPKISETAIQAMVEYIEGGGCCDVGNVWRHLAEKFAPDCNPKTVQDAVKKSGFKNNKESVKLEPLLAEHVPEDQAAPNDDHANSQIQQQAINQQGDSQERERENASNSRLQAEEEKQRQRQQQQAQAAQQTNSNIDPAFQQQYVAPPQDSVQTGIANASESTLRLALAHAAYRFPEIVPFLASYVVSTQARNVPTTLIPGYAVPLAGVPGTFAGVFDGQSTQRQRLAICRRCGGQYDRAENTMGNRQCLYHKGSLSKTHPITKGTVQESPEAFTWSCCGGNGSVAGCSRAMHTTKKKRNHGRKRDATTAGLDRDGESDSANDETLLVTGLLSSVDSEQQRQQQHDPNIDSRLEGLQTVTLCNTEGSHHDAQLALDMAAQLVAARAESEHTLNHEPATRSLLQSADGQELPNHLDSNPPVE